MLFLDNEATFITYQPLNWTGGACEEGINYDWVVRASGIAIEMQRVVNGILKRSGIGSKMKSKERSEKVSEFNVKLISRLERENIKKFYLVKVYVEVEGDENDFVFDVNSLSIFVAKPELVINAEDVIVVGDDLDDIYKEYLDKVVGSIRSSKHKSEGVSAKVLKLDEFLRKL